MEKKGAVVVDTKMNYNKIQKDFKRMTDDTKRLIDKYNKSVNSIKSQELAIDKVKNKLQKLSDSKTSPKTITSLEKSLKSAELEIEKLQTKWDATMDRLEGRAKIRILVETHSKETNNLQQLIDFDAKTLNMKAETDSMGAQLDNLKARALKLKATLENTRINTSTPEMNQLTAQLNFMQEKLVETKDKANDLKLEIENSSKTNFGNSLGQSVDNIGKKIDKFKTKMSRLIGTAMVFGLLRNSLTALRNNFIGLLKENDTFSSSLNQIKANLMTAFAPIYNAILPAINSLMNALSKVTGTIAAFVSGLFGKSLGNAKEDAEGLSKSLKKVGKNGEEASGSLSSIDKLDVIGGNESSGSGGASSSDTGIDYNGDIQISQTLLNFLNAIKDFVIENKELILGLFSGIVVALGLIKLRIDGIKALGIGLVIAGIVTLIQGIVNFIKDPSWSNFATILEGLALILAGVAVAMLAVEAANPVAWIMLAIAAVVALGAIIIKNWDKIKEVLGKVGGWIYDHLIAPIENFFSGLWEGIKSIFSPVFSWFNDEVIKPLLNAFERTWEGLKVGAKEAWEGIKSIFSTVATFFKNIFSNAWEGVKKVFSVGGKIFDGIKDGILNGFKAIVNAIIKGINKVVSIPFNGINWALNKIKNIEFLGISPFKKIIKTIDVPKIPELAKGAVIPPRQRFAAILGDQRHGTNIEAPLETIKQANREVLLEFFDKLNGLTNQVKDIVLKNFTIVAQFGDRNFRQVVYEAIRLTEQELGKPLFVS